MKDYYYHSYNAPKKTKKIFKFQIVLVVIVATIAFYYISGAEPVTYKPEIAELEVNLPEGDINLPWPKYGHSALGEINSGILSESKGSDEQVPIASVAKVMTAYAILKKQPLNPGETGPEYQLTEDDKNIYNKYFFKDGSVTTVKPGIKINQYQALQAILIKSSNNMADSMVERVFGSMDEYLNYSNQLAGELGLENTVIADASGFSPKTKSSANDLVKLGAIALSDPVFKEIVGTWQTKIPGHGTITSTNLFLDYQNNGVIGIKTGYTDEAEGTYLGAMEFKKSGQSLTLITAALGSKSHFGAQQDAINIMSASKKHFKETVVIKKGTEIARYQNSKAVMRDDALILVWPGQEIKVEYKLDEFGQLPTPQTEAGKIIINNQEFSVVIE